ncbi:MAG: TldD/PmbA family protein [Candidatus Lokiarchaeota archaeon]|nr:TldD/PmbA family protein [Candidatus Lokiarchaeota archaeon]
MELTEDLKIFDEKLINEFNNLSNNKIDYWDIRVGSSTGTSIEFTDKKSKEISSYEMTKCGIRTFYNGGWGFVVVENLSKKSLINKFQKAIKLAQLSESLGKYKFKIKEIDIVTDNFEFIGKKPLENIDITEKINLVKEHEDIANNFNSRIKNTRTLYLDGIGNNIIINSFGSRIFQKLSLLRLFSSVYAQKKGIIQRGVNSVGGLGGFEITQTKKAREISLLSAKEAMNLLDAKSPIGGTFTLIMDPKLTGTFVHEAFGHACEADLVLNKESILEGKIGELVANDNVTIIDDPRFGHGNKFNLPYELYGSYFVDDEGVPSQKTTIIENGIFKNYLHSRETASRMNVKPNGHGRASSNISRPQVRMGITILEPNDWDVEEMIEDTKIGVLCEDFQYGYTDPTTGNFQFKARLSYKIENGEKKELMRDVSLSGMTLQVLNNIDAIGKKINFSDGMCGKGGQSVRVCDGGPYIRARGITVGGLR